MMCEILFSSEVLKHFDENCGPLSVTKMSGIPCGVSCDFKALVTACFCKTSNSM